MARRRTLVYAVLTVLVLLVLVYLVVTALMARSELRQARDELTSVKAQLLSDHVRRTGPEITRADRHAARADSLTGGPVWAMASALPLVGDPFEAVRGMSGDVHRLTSTALPQLVTVATALAPDKLRLGGDRVDIATMRKAAPVLTESSGVLNDVTADIEGLPSTGWVPPVHSARGELLELITDLDTTVSAAAEADRLLPTMLGGNGPRRYLLVFQNEAESRGLGGKPGAFAVIHADDGRISIGATGSDTDITASATVDLGPEYQRKYAGLGSTDLFVNSTVSPDFPTVARIWTSMWEHQTGQHLDGAMVADPTALSYLLDVAGAFQLNPGPTITADNIVPYTEQIAYAVIADTERRKQFFVDVGHETAEHLLQTRGRARDVVDAMAKGVSEHRILVWSSHPREERQIAARRLGGALPRDGRRFVAAIVDNGAGTKLDYYLQRFVDYQVDNCSGATQTSSVTIHLYNNAPTRGLPDYVVTRGDHPATKQPRGSNHLQVSLLATRGATLRAVDVDGEPVDLAGGAVFRAAEAGHPSWSTPVDINPAAGVVVKFTYSEPRVTGPVDIWTQPLVHALAATGENRSC